MWLLKIVVGLGIMFGVGVWLVCGLKHATMPLDFWLGVQALGKIVLILIGYAFFNGGMNEYDDYRRYDQSTDPTPTKSEGVSAAKESNQKGE